MTWRQIFYFYGQNFCTNWFVGNLLLGWLDCKLLDLRWWFRLRSLKAHPVVSLLTHCWGGFRLKKACVVLSGYDVSGTLVCSSLGLLHEAGDGEPICHGGKILSFGGRRLVSVAVGGKVFQGLFSWAFGALLGWF